MTTRNVDGSDLAEEIAWQLVQKSVSFSYMPLPNDMHEFTVKDDATHTIDDLIRKGTSTPSPVIMG